VLLAYLAADASLIEARMAARQHFMPPSSLRAQFATLEPPDEAEHSLVLDVEAPPEVLVDTLANAASIS
jgi:gluconokinase